MVYKLSLLNDDLITQTQMVKDSGKLDYQRSESLYLRGGMQSIKLSSRYLHLPKIFSNYTVINSYFDI